MRTVLITGAYGFIGKNLYAQLKHLEDIEILRYGRNNTDTELADYVAKADFIFHIAGVNRPKNETEFKQGNKELTEHIVSLLKENGFNTPLLITSSVQAELDNPYGLSKKAAEDAVIEWAKSTNQNVYLFRLPNVFGKWSRPSYNSVVATFCHNIANDLDITINDPDAKVTLVYVDDVVARFVKAMKGELEKSPDNYYTIPRTFSLTLQELADRLRSFKDSRQTLVISDFENNLDRFLYATYTSFFDKDDFGYSLEMKRDDRGWLAEFIKSPHFGQVFVSRTKPSISRGNHWHHTKIEKFLVIDGQANIAFRNFDTNGIITYTVSGDELKVVDIPAGYVHSITNTGERDLLTIFWADEILDPGAPDTYYQNVKEAA